MRYRFIYKHRSTFSVEGMCRVLEVRRSGYYAWKRRGPSMRQRRDRVLLERIRESHRLSKGRYGSPNILEDLREWGYHCSRKRIARLMRGAGLRSKTVRKFRVTTLSKHSLPVADNLLIRDFMAPSPNRVWVSDITYIWTREGWLYLCVVLDLFNRQVVGWAMSKRLGAELAVGALRQALLMRRPTEGMVFHSDRGVQYASWAFREVLKGAGIRQSMSRKGDCWDNAVAESFFATLKRELIYRQSWPTKVRTIAAINEYITCFYNSWRRHKALAGKSPMKYEAAMRMEALAA